MKKYYIIVKQTMKKQLHILWHGKCPGEKKHEIATNTLTGNYFDGKKNWQNDENVK